jgi:hypothetical protein
MCRFGSSKVVASDGFAVRRCDLAEESYLEVQSALIEAFYFGRADALKLAKFLHEELVVNTLWFEGVVGGV